MKLKNSKMSEKTGGSCAELENSARAAECRAAPPESGALGVSKMCSCRVVRRGAHKGSALAVRPPEVWLLVC